MPKLSRVVLFEDDDEFGRDVERAIRRKLPQGFQLERFPLDSEPPAGTGRYEARVASMLQQEQFRGTVLLVADSDLSARHWGGLSEAAIARVGQEQGLPMAWYARGTSSLRQMTRVPGDGRIGVSNKPTELAHAVAIISKGFVDLVRSLKAVRRLSGRPKTPGALLAGLLGAPAAASHLDAYACGDQRVVAELLAPKGGDSSDHRRLAVALGVWIVDVVLAYPGVLLEEDAAASYLDIDPRDFTRPSVRGIFRTALWRNAPFVDRERPRWWRSRLDDIIAKNGTDLGRQVANSRLKKPVRYCPCHVDRSEHAGYFCMVEQKPVSAKHSVGPISWFPPGADLARVTKTVFDKVGPWLGA